MYLVLSEDLTFLVFLHASEQMTLAWALEALLKANPLQAGKLHRFLFQVASLIGL